MRAGEGLVGLIAATAEPLSLSADAQSHPAFSYRPETGEEVYHAFLGVAAAAGRQHAGRAGGAEPHLPGLFRGGDRGAPDHRHGAGGDDCLGRAAGPVARHGQRLAPGAQPMRRGAGRRRGPGARRAARAAHRRAQPDRRERRARSLAPRHRHRGGARGDRRPRRARRRGGGRRASGGARDRQDVRPRSGLAAADARGGALGPHGRGRGGAGPVGQPRPDAAPERSYLRERLHDLDDLANRLLRQLVGRPIGGQEAMPENAILVARSMGPAALLDYDRSRLRGVVLEEGGPTSHIAIVARALGIRRWARWRMPRRSSRAATPSSSMAAPVRSRSGRAGDRGGLCREGAAPGPRQEQYRALRDVPAVTRDGVAVGLQLNAGLIVDLSHLNETGPRCRAVPDRVLQFMVAERMPSAAEQQVLYEAVFDAVGDLPVTIRTLDIGGDKVLPYMKALEEENPPSAGGRSASASTGRASCGCSCARSSRPHAGGRSRSCSRWSRPSRNSSRQRESSSARRRTSPRHGHPLPADCRLGVMVEVPSLLFQMDEIARKPISSRSARTT